MVKIRAIVPTFLVVDPKRYARVVENTLDGLAENVRIDFQVTTQTWRRRPAFQVAARPSVRLVFTDNKIYSLLDAGTAPHIIRPRNARALRFMRTGFQAKSRVRAIRSNKGRAANKDLTIVKSVRHPGTQAREWADTISEKWQSKIARLFEDAFAYEVSYQTKEAQNKA